MTSVIRQLIALLGLLALLRAVPAYAVSDPAEMLPNPAQERRAEAIGAQLRCLVCQNMTIEDSDAKLARDLRRIVRQHVAAGESNQAVVAWMVARYGEFVRLNPPFEPMTDSLWLSPLLAVGVGAAAAWLGRRHRPLPPEPLSETERARVQALLRL
ncbi:MAG: cytochrome c-type biogenesis protein CcmH [Acidocella sp.]|nr:cytochrome c-type biogenesis protein CcmH [Acidocella sp.]